MALFGISDIHLSLSSEKPMDIFEGWSDYVDRLRINWEKRVSENDIVVLPGDISWAMSLSDTKSDFSFIERLPGKKIISKGNHDYWWVTVRKIERWFEENNFLSISVMHNKSYMYNDIAISGTRGWVLEEDDSESMKIYMREVGRLRLSLEDAKKRNPREIIAFMHYPPVCRNYKQVEIIDVFKEFGINRCFYGHIHGKNAEYSINGNVDGIYYKLISADHIGFSPYFIN